MTRGHFIKFTDDEVAQIIAWRKQHVTYAEIGRRLHCSLNRIKDKMAALGIASPGVKRTQRKCLGCLGKFMSAGPHNRQCPACKALERRDAGRFTAEHRVAR